MYKIKTISVLMVLMVSLLALGCGGGGASSVPVEKDVVGITRTLNDFMAASRTNDQEKLQSVLAAPIEYYLMVKDFGEDITNPNDNKEYEFYVTSDLIDQPSSDLAHVYAYYMLHSGQPYWLYFRMVREDGRWVIEEMTNKAPQAGGYVQPIVPTPQPAAEFVAASYSKLDGGIRKIFALEDSFGKVLPLRMDTSYLSPYLENGITFYELYEIYVEPSEPGYEGFVPSATSRRSLASSIVNRVKRNLRGSRLSLRAQTAPPVEPEIFVHYGLDSEGAFWMRMVESTSMMIFNNGQPVKLFEKSHPFGASRSVSYPYTVDGKPFKIDITINIGNPVTGFVTPLQTYTAVPLTFTSVDSEFPAEGDKWVEYYALGIGEVGYDYFDTPTSAQPSEIERLLTRFNSDGSLNQRNDPVITNTNTFLGSYNVGDTITPMQVSSSGGVAPYEFRWHSDEIILYSMPPGVTLSRTGVISGIAPGSGAGETFYGKVEVVDKYFRHTYKEFSIESLVSEGGSVPPPASIFFAASVSAPAPFMFAGINLNPDPTIPGYSMTSDSNALPLLFQTPRDGSSVPSDEVQVFCLSTNGWLWNDLWTPALPMGNDGYSYILSVGTIYDLYLENNAGTKFVRIRIQVVNVNNKLPVDRGENDLRLDVLSYTEGPNDPLL